MKNQKINTQVWFCYTKKKKTIEKGAEDRYSSEPEKAYPTGEFIIMVREGREGGEGGRLKT